MARHLGTPARALLMLCVLTLAACATAPPPDPSAPRPASLRIITQPTSASILIGGQRLNSGQRIHLQPGVYDLVVELENHHRHSEQVVLAEGVNMDRVVRMRPLEAELVIRADPADTELRIGDRRPQADQSISLRPGQYEIEASREGYFPERTRVRLEPGEQQTLEISLQRIPTADQLTLRAHHPEASIFLDGNELGTGAVTLQQDFGSFRLESIRELADWRRERAEQRIDFQRGAQQQFQLADAQLEYLYLGRWLSAEQVLLEEQQVYEARRVGTPIHVHARLTATSRATLLDLENPTEWLFSLLRPGDRLTLEFAEHEVVLWARGNRPDAAFVEAVAALQAGTSYEPPWVVPEEQAEPTIVSLQEPADLAFAVLATQPYSPLLSLEGRGLSALTDSGIGFGRIAADGELRLLAQGGEGLALDAIPLESGDLGLIDHSIAMATAEHRLTWDNAPDRLLLIPASGPLVPMPERVELKRGEKRVVPIDLPVRPERVRQLTLRVDGEGQGDWETLEWTIAPGQAPDLREVDFGPHAREGAYRRSWIFEYRRDAGLTQRQVDADYYIGEEQAQVQSGLFLRRQPGAVNQDE